MLQSVPSAYILPFSHGSEIAHASQSPIHSSRPGDCEDPNVGSMLPEYFFCEMPDFIHDPIESDCRAHQ